MLAGCGQAAAPSTLAGEPATYLLGIDQLVSPDFVLDMAPHSQSPAQVTAATGASTQQLSAAGLLASAEEEFFRPAGNLAEVNGPVQVRDSVEEFSSTPGAATVYGADIARLDKATGATPTSTGALGDAAHAITRVATSAGGVAVIEITVEWRVDNLLDVLVVRGRNGGTRLDDALLLAHRQTTTELGLSTPPGATATATP